MYVHSYTLLHHNPVTKRLTQLQAQIVGSELVQNQLALALAIEAMSSKALVALLYIILVDNSFGQNCSHGEVRLRGGTEFAGRVEVCANGIWGTICDRGWDHQDAWVVCKQLNLSNPDSPGQSC